MSTYGWTVAEVDRLPWLQTLALIEEIKHARQREPESSSSDEVLNQLPNVEVRRNGATPKRVVFTKTGSRLVGLVNKKTGERVI